MHDKPTMILESCTSCGANWLNGEYTPGCLECGGGAMERPCLNCGGRCGVPSRRQVLDSRDSGEAHWLIDCSWRVWVNKARLPIREEAILRGGEDMCAVMAASRTHVFDHYEEALSWLETEGFVPEVTLTDPREV